jgi:uncharacterized protein (DUF433 family)
VAKHVKRPASTSTDWSPDDFIEIPTGPGKRTEPYVRGKGVPVWVLWAYANQHGMSPKEISKLWPGRLTEEEVSAALLYAVAHPDLIEDKTKG